MCTLNAFGDEPESWLRVAMHAHTHIQSFSWLVVQGGE